MSTPHTPIKKAFSIPMNKEWPTDSKTGNGSYLSDIFVQKTFGVEILTEDLRPAWMRGALDL